MSGPFPFFNFVKRKHGLKSDPFGHGEEFRFRGPTRDRFIVRNDKGGHQQQQQRKTRIIDEVLWWYYMLMILYSLSVVGRGDMM